MSTIAPQRKSKEQRRIERVENLARYELGHARGETRGWQIVPSQMMPVWQFIRGGAFQPLTKTNINVN